MNLAGVHEAAQWIAKNKTKELTTNQDSDNHKQESLAAMVELITGLPTKTEVLKKTTPQMRGYFLGAPGGTRTPSLLIRSFLHMCP